MNKNQIEDLPKDKEEIAEIIKKQAEEYNKKLEEWRSLFSEIPGVGATTYPEYLEQPGVVMKLCIPKNNNHLLNKQNTCDSATLFLWGDNRKYSLKFDLSDESRSWQVYLDWCVEITKCDKKSWSYLYTMLLILSSYYSNIPELPIDTKK